MRAVVVHGLTEPGKLRVSDVAAPEAGPGEVVIAVRAAGCNFSDLLMLRGEYQVKPSPPFIPGREAAGVVSEVGPGVQRVRPGDRVVAYTDLGAFAEQVCVSEGQVHALPDAVGFEAGAALPIAAHRAQSGSGKASALGANPGPTGPPESIQIRRPLGLGFRLGRARPRCLPS